MQKRKHGKSRVEQCLEHSIRQDLKIKRLQERLRAIEQLLGNLPRQAHAVKTRL